MTGELYLLTFASGRQYVGISRNSGMHRFKRHGSDARRGSQKVVHKAWRKYGAPRLDILVRATEEYLRELEPKVIAAYRTRFPHGYNMAHGGEIAPSMAPIVAARISAAKKGKPIPQTTMEAAWAASRGKKWTAEERARLSAARMGRVFSEETRKKMSDAQKGKPRPPESIRKMAATLTGRKLSPEHVANIRAGKEKARLARLLAGE